MRIGILKAEGGILEHKSYVTVSDEMAHKATTVLTFLDDLIPELIDPQLDSIHYWSDSTSSQYRNKYIYDAIANHEATYGCRAIGIILKMDTAKVRVIA